MQTGSNFDWVTTVELALGAPDRSGGHFRVLLGSDYPADMAAPDPVAALDSPLISPFERRAILSGNIRHAIGDPFLEGLSCTCGQQH